MTELRELAPAKVNLSLHVGPPKQNGRHDLMSLVTFAGIEAADVLTAEPASTFCLAVEGPFARDSGPAKDNLVLQAARMLDEALDGNAPPLAFRLQKNLPCAAGIGGGSADAAAALRLIIRAHGGDKAMTMAEAISPLLGGDVLACLRGVPGLMSGEGERYEPLLGIPPFPAILVNPLTECPTGPVFSAYDANPPSAVPAHPLPPAGRARPGDFVDWVADNTNNGLEAPASALVPDINTTLSALRNLQNTKLVRMSGSGATCFALFPDMDSAEKGKEALKALHPDWWICSTLLGGGT
jgi:4-diphosphocytidyl-2-C-methyl-D-erythritol kinase